MSSQQVSNYANNRTRPNADVMERFARVGMNLNWLLTGDGPMRFESVVAEPIPPYQIDPDTADLLAHAIENPRPAPLDHLRALRELNEAQRQIIEALAGQLPEAR